MYETKDDLILFQISLFVFSWVNLDVYIALAVGLNISFYGEEKKIIHTFFNTFSNSIFYSIFGIRVTIRS